MTQAAEDLKLMIKDEQQQLAPGRGDQPGGGRVPVVVSAIGRVLSLLGAVLLSRAISGPIAAISRTASRFADGDLDEEIGIRQKDEVGVLADCFREMQKQLRGIVAETGSLIAATNEGRLAVRADATAFVGGWRGTIEGINGLADAYAKPLQVTADYVDRIARGDIPPKIADSYNGDFNAIKNNLNRCIDAVQRLVDDAQGLVKASVEGRLSYRADATRHQGEYARIVGGVNRVVDVLVGHLDAMPNPAMIVGPDFGIRYMNDTGTRLLGRSKQELVGSKCYDQFKTSDCRTDKCACARAMRSGSNVNAETDAHPNGKDLDVAYTGVPMRDEGGKTIGAFEVMTDLTEIKQTARIQQKCGTFQGREIEKLVVTLDKVAKGDLDVALSVDAADEDTAEVAGNFERINTAVDNTVQALRALIADANRLSEAALAGRLQTRADAGRHQGEYRRIVEGVNATLDAIVAPIDEAAGVLERLANYDLRARMEGESAGDFAKIKDSLNRTGEGLHEAIAQVNEAVGQVASAAEQIAATSQAVAQGASEQASSLEETSSALEQMTGQTKQNADNTHQARALAKSTRARPRRAARPWGRWWRPWPRSANPPRAPAPSSRTSTRSPSRRICSRSTPRSRRRAPATPAGASRWWPRRCATSRCAPRRRPRRPRR